jgi:hypothetical protein
VEYPTETAARRALQEQLLSINGVDAYIAQGSPTFGTVLDKFIADERLIEIKARRPGEIVDDGLKYSTTTGYLSLIKLHLRPDSAALSSAPKASRVRSSGPTH